jgi:hypothetical protein
VGIELNPGPGTGEHLSIPQRWEIVFSTPKKNPNYSQIGRKVGCSRKSVKQVLKKYQETGTVEDLAGRGRKRTCTEAEVKTMVKKAKKGKFAPEIARESKKKVATRTVQTYIKDAGIKWLRIKKIEKLSNAHKRKRVEYSERMKGYNWNKVLFSDEKTFFLGASPGYAWQDPKHRITEEKTPYPEKLNVWGAIGTHMKTKLYYFDTNLNSELYSTILKNRIKEKQLIYSSKCPKKLPKNWIFLQDNAKYHRSAKSMKTVEDLVGSRWIEHPAKSPDLNPMEDMWSYLDRKVKEARPKTIKSLKRTLTRAWNALTWSYVAKSTTSMDRRLEQCIEKGGQRLDY